MLKDIPQLIVEDVAVAIVKEKNKEGEEIWNAYLLNLKDSEITAVLVTSNGYGTLKGEEVKTSVLRHFLDTVPPHSALKIEPIMENLFGVTNQFWVSFVFDKQMYDKKYIFLPETICPENFIHIPLLNSDGVLIL